MCIITKAKISALFPCKTAFYKKMKQVKGEIWKFEKVREKNEPS